MSTPFRSNFNPMKKFYLLRYIGLILLTAYPGFADTTLGTGINSLDPKSGAPVNYQLEGSINCPVATFGTGVFVGNGTQWGNNDFAPFNSYNAGGANIGGLAGITIPLGGSLAQYCRKQAETQLERQVLLRLNERRSAAIYFLAQCEWIRIYYPGSKTLPIDSNAKEKNNNPFELFRECPIEEAREEYRPEVHKPKAREEYRPEVHKPKANKPNNNLNRSAFINESPVPSQNQITPPPSWEAPSPYVNPIPVQANPR